MPALSSPARRPRLRWIIVLLFLIAVMSVPAAYRFLRSPPPENLTKLAERIRAKHPEWHLVPIQKAGSYEDGFWVCHRPCSWEELMMVPALPDSGILTIKANPNNDPPCEIYGDTAMLEETLQFLP